MSGIGVRRLVVALAGAGLLGLTLLTESRDVVVTEAGDFLIQ